MYKHSTSEERYYIAINIKQGMSKNKIAVDKLNSRPGKCLEFKTPYQVFFERTGIDVRQLGVVHL
ncbi:MAG: hypothetical protein DSY43_02880 [Gammaproteobacteria bacterium]|nr:MAG: hypothetical protein DSY43_02880 [Gammaproteobacteria bacterium]